MSSKFQSDRPEAGATKTLIREAGLRATRGRIAVYDALRNTQSPLNHSELVASLEDLQLDQATIYRNLMDLTRVGLLRRTDLGDHVWRFELVSEGHTDGEHPHFVCVDCGLIQCLPDVDININGDVPSKSAVQIRLEGHCGDCD